MSLSILVFSGGYQLVGKTLGIFLRVRPKNQLEYDNGNQAKATRIGGYAMERFHCSKMFMDSFATHYSMIIG